MINDLCEKKILRKEQDPEDKRVSLVSPTTSTLNEFVNYFESVSAIVTQP
jgi:DNA-binding MarR family transcriptional regulator